MKTRCKKIYVKPENYFLRGIRVCPEWESSFMNFYEDMYPTYQDGLLLDRIDNDGNYCKDNCRWVTKSQNQMNTRSHRDSSSRYKGVFWDTNRSKWHVKLCIDGKSTYIGYFKDEIEAARAYDKKAFKLFGEFAKLNGV